MIEKSRRQFALGLCLLFIGFLCVGFGTPASPQLMLLTGAGKAPSAAPGCVFPTLANLIGNWRADTGTSTSGGNITAVVNLANPGTNNLAATVGSVPFTASSAYHSLPAFGFTVASSAALTTASFPASATTDLSVFAVGRMATAAGANAGLVTYGTTGNDFNGVGNAVMIAVNGTPDGMVFQSNVSGGISSTMSFDTNHRFGYTVDFSATTIKGYVDGTAVTTANPATVALVTNGTLVVGNRFLGGAPGNANGWEGPILQIVITNAVMSPTDVTNLDNFFTCQYGT